MPYRSSPFPVLALVAGMFLLPPLAAAPPKPKPAAKPGPKRLAPPIAYVRQWFGTVRVVIEGSGTSTDGRRWRVDRHAEAQIAPAMPDALIAHRSSVDAGVNKGTIPPQYVELLTKGLNSCHWMGKVLEKVMPVTESLNESDYGKFSGVSRSGTYTGTDPEGASIIVDLEKKTYEISVGFPSKVSGSETRTGPSGSTPQSKSFTGIGRFKVTDQKVTSADTLSGRAEMPASELSRFRLGKDGDIRGHYEWHLTSKRLAEVDLVIKDTPAYRNWIPEGAPEGGAPGNTLTLEAELVGGEPGEQIDYVMFRLDDGSMQPGYSVNTPRKITQEMLDLRFQPQDNPPGKVTPSPIGGFELRIEKPGRRAAAVISSFDWGGWAQLQAHVRTTRGRLLYGTFEGSSFEVPLPDREPGSNIAKKWLADRGVAGKVDADDAETFGAGDKYLGDGLSLYEEYRGFYEDGVHQYGDPKKKDMFVRNRSVSPGVKAGIALFESVSNLEVHDRLTEDELADRRINFNDEYAHAVNQHGVVIEELDPGLGAPGYAEPMPGAGSKALSTPKDYKSIQLHPKLETVPAGAKTRGMSSSTGKPYIEAAVAHELFHTVNLVHHGDTKSDSKREWMMTYAGGKLVSVTEAGKPVSVEDEQGAPPPLTRPSFTIFVGEHGGLFSGDEECVMRYADAAAFIPPGRPNVRVFVGNDDLQGRSLCNSKAGTGANDKAWNGGKPRFGDATAGNCRARLCVNDKY